MTLNPFQNETECITIGDFTIENRALHVSFFGSLDITKDKVGLKNALLLKEVLDSIVKELECEELPDVVERDNEVKIVPNPFIKQDS